MQGFFIKCYDWCVGLDVIWLEYGIVGMRIGWWLFNKTTIPIILHFSNQIFSLYNSLKLQFKLKFMLLTLIEKT